MNETELAHINYTATGGDSNFVMGKTFVPTPDEAIKCQTSLHDIIAEAEVDYEAALAKKHRLDGKTRKA